VGNAQVNVVYKTLNQCGITPHGGFRKLIEGIQLKDFILAGNCI
jgi:hypothetical protein